MASAREVAELLIHAETALLLDDSRDERLLRELHHDLRTPLSAIKGYAELLLEEGGAPTADLERLIRRVRELVARVEALGAAPPDRATPPEDGAHELAAALAATAGRLEPLAAMQASRAACW